jgi:hypothetical protein
MHLRFTLTPEHHRIFERHLRAGARRGLRPADGLPILAAVASGGGLAGLLRVEHPDWRAVLLLAIIALLALSAIAFGLWRRSGRFRNPEAWIGELGVVLTPAGISLSLAQGVRFLPWPDILAGEETGDDFYLYYRSDAALIVPKAALAEPGDGDAFAATVRRFWEDHPENRGRRLPERPARLRHGLKFLAGLGAVLRAGYGLAVFRPVDGHAFRVGGFTLAGLMVLQLLLHGLRDYVAAGPEPRFSPYGLADHGAGLVLFLFSGLVLGGMAGNAAQTVRLLALIAAAEWLTALLYLSAYAGFRHLPEAVASAGLWGAFLVWLAWNFAIVFRAVGTVYRLPAPAALFLASVFALFNWGVGFYLPDPELFYAEAKDGPGPARAPAIDGEAVLYRQSQLVRAATESLLAERPGVTDLYFVGFAGEADEHVFAHEIDHARKLFDRRYGTAGRSLVLVNSPDTIERLPLANAHNLEAALQAVARRMNPAEDVLFLFLTSHGSKDHQLSVRFQPLPLNDLPAAKLKELLDRSGIRHRIIVVSACYSGGFLDVLKDEHSLILTAARRDRTSFGCGTESDFTYFGDAYFVQALPETRSFIDAFARARALIEAREQGEGKEPSVPQLHVGPAIVPKLKELEARVE